MPEVLYNIAHTAERIRHDERALEAFEEYLRLVPESEERAAIEARIDTLRQALEERADAEVTPSEPDPPDAPPPSSDPAPEGPTEASGGPGSVGAFVVLGIGGAAAVTGVILLAVAAARAAEVSNAEDGTPWLELASAYQDADAFGITGGVLLAVGGAAVAAGLLWGILDASPENAVEVGIGPGRLHVRGRF